MDTPDPTGWFDKEGIRLFSSWFREIAVESIKEQGWDCSQIAISSLALANAFSESSRDIQAIINRRQHPPVSHGKIAGVITFRLFRWAPIHLNNDLLENPLALKLNAIVPFNLCLYRIMRINITDLSEETTKEFLYTLLRRHTNQETLGLVYDMISHNHS